MVISISLANLKSLHAWRATTAEFIAVLLLVFFGLSVILSALCANERVLNTAG